ASRDLVQESLVDALAAARRAAETVFTLLARRLDRESGTTPVLRLGDEFRDDAVWPQGLEVGLDNLLLAFSRLSDGVETIADRLTLDDPSERRAQLLGELRGVARRLQQVAAGLIAALRPPPGGPAAVRWLERRGGGRKVVNVSLAAVPLDLAPILKDNLFDRVETVVLTSATLAAGGDFSYLEARLGLDLPPSRLKVREIHASPFDFAAQCLFGIPTDVPEARAARARPRQAPLQSAHGAAHRRPAGAHRGRGPERVRALPGAKRRPEAQAGVRAPDPEPGRCGGCGAARPAGGDQALWGHDP